LLSEDDAVEGKKNMRVFFSSRFAHKWRRRQNAQLRAARRKADKAAKAAAHPRNQVSEKQRLVAAKFRGKRSARRR
jgi:hypothetical protein